MILRFVCFLLLHVSTLRCPRHWAPESFQIYGQMTSDLTGGRQKQRNFLRDQLCITLSFLHEGLQNLNKTKSNTFNAAATSTPHSCRCFHVSGEGERSKTTSVTTTAASTFPPQEEHRQVRALRSWKISCHQEAAGHGNPSHPALLQVVQ